MQKQVKARGFLWGAFFTLLLFIMPVIPEASGQDQLYVIRNLTVDKVAENAVQARDQAILEGQREAYQMLADRLLMSESGEIPLEEISTRQISSLISDFETRQEQFSDKRYRAKMTVRFKADAVKAFLGQSQTAKLAEVQSKPVLVLPFIRDAKTGKSTLWSRDNLWLQAWEGGVSDNLQLVPVRVPAGDTRDATLAGEGEILSGSVDEVEMLKNQYQADKVVIAEGALTDNGVEVIVYEYIADSLSRTKTISVGTTGTEAQKWAVAVKGVQKYLNDRWKKKLRYSPDAIGNQQAVLLVRFDSMRDWIRMKRMIERNPQINEVQMRALKRDYAEIGAVLTGTLDDLRNSFSSHNLVFRQTQNTGLAGAGQTVYEIYETAARVENQNRQGHSVGEGGGQDRQIRYDTMIDAYQNQSGTRYVQP